MMHAKPDQEERMTVLKEMFGEQQQLQQLPLSGDLWVKGCEGLTGGRPSLSSCLRASGS